MKILKIKKILKNCNKAKNKINQSLKLQMSKLANFLSKLQKIKQLFQKINKNMNNYNKNQNIQKMTKKNLLKKEMQNNKI